MNGVDPQTVLRKVTLRLIPFIFILYVVNILDRVNISFAQFGMMESLKLSEGAYGLGYGLFYIGYFVFEVPSNLILNRIGARRWIARIMISWGLISLGMVAVRGPWSFYLLRVLLGIAEAGFFPGIILYLTYWFPAQQRARAVSRFMTGSPVVGILGSPLSGWIVHRMDHVGPLAGWQWLFLLEGLPAVVLGFVALYYLTDRPQQASWLEPEERDWLAGKMAGEEQGHGKRHGLTLLSSLVEPKVWLFILLYFTAAVGANCMGSHLPKLVANRFEGLDNKFQIGLLSAVPSLGAIIAMILVGAHSDRTGERRWHVALAAFVSATGWALSAWAPTPELALVAWTVAHMGTMSMLAPFWSMPTAFLSGTAAAGGIALINSLGNLGGFFGPNILGQSIEQTGNYASGLLVLAGIMVMGGVLALCVRRDRIPNVDDIPKSPFPVQAAEIAGAAGSRCERSANE